MHWRFLGVVATLLGALATPAMAAEHQHGTPAQRLELGTSAAFAPSGQLYAVSRTGDHVVLQKSDDDGRTWSQPLNVNTVPEAISADGENRPKLAFGPRGSLLVSWTHPLSKPYSGAIRLALAEDGEHFAPPVTVHQDTSEITHRFESMLAGPEGRVVVAWIDKRDLEASKGGKEPYRGAAIYTAVSTDGGRSFATEKKVADHSCECCRIALARDRDGTPLMLWRHVFAPNERDHALARLKADGSAESVQRATFERWRVDACPHHGPSLAVDDQGIRHAVWFNQKDGEGKVFYGRLVSRGNGIQVEGQRTIGGPRAAHADLAVAGKQLVVAWKEFDGEQTRLQALRSVDGGRTFTPTDLGATTGASDQPRIIARDGSPFVFWRTEKEGFRLFPLP